MKIKRIQKSNNNPLHSFHIESEQNILKNLIPINTLKENNNKKIIYSYNILDGFKYKIIIKRKTDNINNIYKIVVSLDHPNIIKLIQYAESDYYFISVSEFFSDISLYDTVSFSAIYDEDKIRKIIYQIILIVNYLHSNNFLHKKLTPHSFLIKKINNDLVIKLDDIHNIFSMIIKNCHQFLIFIYLFIFIFLLLLVYFLVCGEFPLYYYKKNEKKICISKKLIKYYNNPFNIIIFYLFDRWKNFSYKGRDFIKKILLGNMSSIISLREALDHEWFKENIRQNTYINFEMLRSIYNFWKKNTFKRYILNNLAKLIINEDIYICQSLFFYLDILQQGSIKYEQYFIIMKKLGLLDGDINKTIAFQFFKKVDYNNEGIITKKKLYKFYNLKTKNEINSYAKKKFTFEEFYNYIRKE
ncbi:serine/threonine protein kinase [Plasmodium falciparum NF135/5.C10]|uniref:Serine/threonine protein kinase n=3 Tax=Plasmodium falciparum TaxID=5833 RepID=A0A024X167_PLAFC|nr:serine/threonine protein kinase [Plasmodium falciparum NF135/5.C10]ETW47292.1 serine/threonine protein kinase [Plasmodium falciparum MaliPS096_E11]ETW59282.1 serine/threonine protein kinase [Plasmodium falciparum CAMP/Malaysia]